MPADVFELHKRRRAAELWRVRLVGHPVALLLPARGARSPFIAVIACLENREQGGACSPASTDGVPHHEEGACLPTLCTLLSAKMHSAIIQIGD